MSRSVEEHAALIASLLDSVINDRTAEWVALERALGRVVSGDVLSPLDLPLFRNSQMDGFAVRAADVATVPARLPVVADLPAGPADPAALDPGTAVRIMTGAVVPPGADCIVPVEHTAVEGDSVVGGVVTVAVARAAGDFVREPGSDIREGQLLISDGVRLAPRHLAALAAVGLTEVLVRSRVRVAVITTGAELSSNPGAGQIFDANLVALSSAAVDAGAEVVLAERSSDVAEEFRNILNRAVAAADVVFTSGGVSKGAFEVVRDVLEPLGADVVEVRMQPGGPQATTVVQGVPVISFPGNPVSSQVSFAVFVRQLLSGRSWESSAVLAAPLVSVAGKRQFVRGKLLEGGRVEAIGGAGSHLVATMAAADVLIVVPEEAVALEAGREVRVLGL